MPEKPTAGADAGPDGGPGIPCGELTCWAPPINNCWGNPVSTQYIAKYEPNGYCESATCQYPTVQDICASNACVDGACTNPHCEGVTCYDPPSPVCADTNNLTVYNRVGRCKALASKHQ